LAVILYDGLRREEAALLLVSDIQDRRGIQHFKVHSKAARCDTCRCIRWRPGASTSIWKAQGIIWRSGRCRS